MSFAPFTIPNYLRVPFYKHVWQNQFVARQHFFNAHHTGYLGLAVFLYGVGFFNQAPEDRADKYLMNSPGYRIRAARANHGERPAETIAREQARIRYFRRGIDHSLTINEARDLLFKMRENLIIDENEGVQYPYVYKAEIPRSVPDELKVPLYPLPYTPSQN